MFGTRIVIADADPAFRKKLKETLVHAGYMVVADVGHGRALLKAVFQTEPDLVIKDARLPGAEGLEIERIIEEHRAAPVILRHKNPVKAGMISEPGDYRWSSIQAYYGEHEDPTGLTDTSFILGIFAEEQTEAIRRFQEHMKMEIHETCLDDEIKPRKTDGEVKAEIEAMLNGKPVTTLQLMEKQKRDEILRRSKVIEGATQRQIARVTGLNQNIVFKA